MAYEFHYDLATRIKAIKSLNAKLADGLKMLRLIGPDLDPGYNNQVGVVDSVRTKVETGVFETNRAGKTLLAAGIVAAAARDMPLVAHDGREIHVRPEHHRDREITLWGVGLQLNHIGQTMFRMLFEPGAFQVIRDKDTGASRSYRPWDKWDQANADRCRPAPPLIPPSEINQKSWVWESKSAKQVAMVSLKNGSTLCFYPSTGEVKKGDPVHGIWIDELIRYSDHYPEWIARLTDYQGWLLWSSMLYRNVPAMNLLIERAQLQQEEFERGERPANRVISKVFTFRSAGNPYLSAARLEINREIFESAGDDVVKQRLEGGDIFDSTVIYPFFDKRVHCAIPEDKNNWDDLAQVLSNLNGLPPADWAHEMIIDPGAQKPAVLFVAVPPLLWRDEAGKEWSLWAGRKAPSVVPYDEIYGKRYTLKDLIPIIQEKMRGIRFRRFIIDMQGGRLTSMTGGPPPHRLYSEAFADAGIESEESGVNFVAGGQDFQGRRRIIDNWLQIQATGYPQLRIVIQRCPNLVWQLRHNQFAMEGDIVTDKAARREKNDLRCDLEYFASRNRGPEYVHVPQRKPLPAWFNRAMEWEERMFGHEPKATRCHFGPGVAP